MQPDSQAKPKTAAAVVDDDELLAMLERCYTPQLRLFFRNRRFLCDVDDLVQEAFKRVAAAMRGGMRLDKPAGFLIHTASLIAHEQRRREEKERQRTLELEWDELPDRHHDLEAELLRRERHEVLLAALKHLSPVEQEIIRRVIINEDDRAQVCDDLGVTPEKLRVKLHRAQNRLEQLVQEKMKSSVRH